MKKLRIADSTLRQAAKNRSHSLSFKEKIEIAKLLDKLAVDVIELAPIEDAKTDSLLTKSICSSVENSILALPCELSENGIKVEKVESTDSEYTEKYAITLTYVDEKTGKSRSIERICVK